MGFDPRQWPSAGRSSRPITSNLDALLAENDALRQEVLRLRRRLERLEREPRSQSQQVWVSAEQVRQWAYELTLQSGWAVLRAGDDDSGLQGLIAELNRCSFLPQLSLEQRLDRLAPGLGRDLQAAVQGLRSKQRWAVLAAFALYGVSAREWLSDAPQRVVADLRLHVQRLERRAAGTRSQQRNGSRTRSDRRSTDRESGGSAPGGVDPARWAAYQELGLGWGASREAIKKAHRRLVKQHHPDMGGEAEAFRRVNAAYQLLMA
jgi:DnaJ-domain-containing protein 1